MVLLGKVLAHATTVPESRKAPENVREKIVMVTKEDLQNRQLAEAAKFRHLSAALAEERDAHTRNTQQLAISWRRVLAAVKSEDFKKELELHSFLFQRELDSKDSYIQSLDSRLEDCLEQYQVALRAHYIHLDKFDALLTQKLETLDACFQDSLTELKTEFVMEHEHITQSHSSQRLLIQEMTESVREEEKKKAAVIKENFQQLKEEIKDKTGEEMEIMQTEMNSKKVNIYNALENLFQRFMNDSKDKFKKYTSLLEENTNESRAIDETMKKITRAKEKIKLTSLKVFQMEKEFEEKNNQIKSENDEIARNFLDLKNKMFAFRDEEKRRLTRLSRYSKEAVEQLTQLCGLGERTLKEAELCRRLEFESEKILPFYDESVPALEEPSEEELGEESLDKSEKDLLIRCGKFEAFKNFFKKYNKVFMDKSAAEKEQKELAAENQILKAKITKYMEGLTVNQSTLTPNSNPLFTSTAKRLVVGSQEVHIRPVIEAAVRSRVLNLQINQVNRC